MSGGRAGGSEHILYTPRREGVSLGGRGAVRVTVLAVYLPKAHPSKFYVYERGGSTDSEREVFPICHSIHAILITSLYPRPAGGGGVRSIFYVRSEEKACVRVWGGRSK